MTWTKAGPAATAAGVVRTRYRQHELAGDARAGIWARNSARRAQRRYLRANWRRLTTAVLIIIVMLSLAAALLPAGFPRGFLLGAGLAGIAGAGWCWVLQVTGTAPAMMGNLAEQWTASELRPLRRHGWRVVNHLSLKRGDIDHVLVGPGGAFAVETKWSAQAWQLAPPDSRVLRAVDQARSNANDLARWHSIKAAGVPGVQPLVVLWGAGTGRLETPLGGLLVNGAIVIVGPSAARWRAGLPTDVLTTGQVDSAWQALDRQARIRDAHDRDPHLPPSVGQMTHTATFTAAAAALGFLVAASLLRPVGSIYAWVLVCLGLILVAVPLRSHPKTRLPALGWQTGAAATLLMAATAGLAQVLS